MDNKKYLVVASKRDRAGINITTHLSQFQNPKKFDFYLVEEEIIFTENLDLEKINKYDFIIFASRHKSTKEKRTLSIHPVGNFREAKSGGVKGKLGKCSALFQKKLFEKLNENTIKYGLKDYDVTLETTHHGPLIDKPSVFVEIGSTNREYKDRRAGFVIAKSISEAIEEFKENPYNEVAIGIGGPHYCPNFNKIQLKSNVAISHIIPSYAFPLTEDMVREAIEKTHEEIDFALIDWKSIGNAEQRQEILNVLDKLYVSYKKTSEISK
jgi:D-aminoacyl-tRNA deacylase|tara:strand:+ start:701 stop:1504 length:804 start_codon:yes stop_codon:yes gene_type:complete